MMITLRGLPPDIEVSEIRSYIYGRCAVGRVIVDDPEKEADGTQCVTVATCCDADALTLRRVLSGERLGVYKLLVEPWQPQDAFSNLRNHGGPGDCVGSGERTAGGSVGFGANLNFGGSSGRGGFIGHSGEPSVRESIRLGKRNRGDDCVDGSSSKIRRDFSERDADPYDVDSDLIQNSSQGRGGYSGPKSSHVQGIVRYNEANNVQDDWAPGGYKEPNSFSGGGDLDRHIAIRKDPPHTYDDKREIRELARWQHVRSRGEEYPEARSDSREWQQDMRSGPMQQQNHAPDSGQWFGNYSRPGSGQVTPWPAERSMVPIQGSRDRSPSPRHESSRFRERAILDRRPADRALPDWDRSPNPPFRGAQPSMDNQRREHFLPAPHAAPHQPPLFSNNVITDYHQYGSGLPQTQPQFMRPIPPKQSQFKPRIQPMGMRPHYGQHINKFKNSFIKNTESRQGARPASKSALRNRKPIRDQKLSPKPDQFRKPPSEYDYKYIHYASNIVKTMIDDTKVDKGDLANAKSFTTVLKKLIENRLRDLTQNDPFGKDLIYIYRKAFPHSTDKETLTTISKQLSLPKVPIHLKDDPNAYTKPGPIPVNDFSDLTKYVDSNLIVDPQFKESLEENVKAENLLNRTAAIITNQLLKPESKGRYKGMSLEEGLQTYLKDLIVAELAKFPREDFFSTDNVDVILRLYYENTPQQRNRKLIEMAIEKFNEKEPVPYKGIFTKPDKVAAQMQFWPDLYLKPGETSPVTADVPKEKKYLQKDLRIKYASIVIAAQVYVQHKVDYLKVKTELDLSYAEYQVRLLIQERLKKLASTDFSNILSSRSLVALYRSKYPEQADGELLEAVFKQLLEQRTKKGNSESAKTRLVFRAANILVGQTVYGRMLTKEERQQLTKQQQQLLAKLQALIQKSITRISDESKSRYHNYEQACKMYRKHFPQSEDEAFVRYFVKQHALDPDMSSPDDEAEQKKNQESKSTNSQEVSESTVAGWREACVCQVAQEALYGAHAMKMMHLSEFRYTKIKIARKIVREQMNEINKGKHGAISKFIDVYELYRKFHPLTEDAALKESVNRESATESVSVNRLVGWREMSVCQVVDEALHGRKLSRKQRDELPKNVQEQMKLARAWVRTEMEEMIAGNPEAIMTASDLHRLYRELHPPEEDAALKERATREAAAISDAKQRRSDSEKLEMISDTTVKGWCESILWQVADEALFGKALNSIERKVLAKSSLQKADLARAIVRERLEKIIAENRAELHRWYDLYVLYRQLHPEEKDADLKELVMRKAEEMKAAAGDNKNQAVSRPVNNGNPNEGSPGCPTDDINLTADTTANHTNLPTDEMEDNGESTADITDTNTDMIKDYLVVPSDDIDVDDDDLEDY